MNSRFKVVNGNIYFDKKLLNQTDIEQLQFFQNNESGCPVMGCNRCIFNTNEGSCYVSGHSIKTEVDKIFLLVKFDKL
jgi:hypothetical protein